MTIKDNQTGETRQATIDEAAKATGMPKTEIRRAIRAWGIADTNDGRWTITPDHDRGGIIRE